jgi:hypothetical protein
MQDAPAIVAPYCGQNQPQQIIVPLSGWFKESAPEEGCWAMIPYAQLYPQAPLPEYPGPTTNDLWTYWGDQVTHSRR